MTRYLLLSVMLLALAGCSATPPHQSVQDQRLLPVSGKVTFHRLPEAGVRICAYPADAASLTGAAPYRSEPTGDDGRFGLGLPPGDYYLLAEGKGLFGWYGRNPVAISSDGAEEISLALVEPPDDAPGMEPFVETGVMGRILSEGRPLSGATIFIYTDLTSRLKGMGYAMAGPTDEEGFFEAALPPGTYYLLARLRKDGGGVGPLRPGDFIGFHAGNPVVVGEDEVARVAIAMIEVPDKGAARGDRLFGDTRISGRILDVDGRPVAGARAVLYDDPQMFNRPLFVSRPTGADGKYILSFPRGGTYHLAARDTLGGAPGPGDLYGTWDANPDHSLQIAAGEERRGIDIVVEEMW